MSDRSEKDSRPLIRESQTPISLSTESGGGGTKKRQTLSNPRDGGADSGTARIDVHRGLNWRSDFPPRLRRLQSNIGVSSHEYQRG